MIKYIGVSLAVTATAITITYANTPGVTVPDLLGQWERFITIFMLCVLIHRQK